MNYQEFLNKYLGQSKGYPTDSQYKGECLSIVKLYIKECFGIDPPPSGTGSAYGYWSNFPAPLGTKFEKVLNTDELIPEVGWIVIWQPWSSNQYGHIAIVAEGSTTGTLKNYAQNWTSRTFQLESNRYTNVVGFLKPLKILDDNMTEEQKRILAFLEGKTEGDVREAFGALTDSPNKDKQIQTLQARTLDLETSLKTLEERIALLEAKIEENLKLVSDWQKKYETANKSLENANKSNIELVADRNTWKARYETALKNQVNKYTGWQLIRLGIAKLTVQK